MKKSDLTKDITANKVKQLEEDGFKLAMFVGSSVSKVAVSPSHKLFDKAGIRDYGLVQPGQALLVVEEDLDYKARFHKLSVSDLKDLKKVYEKAKASNAAFVMVQQQEQATKIESLTEENEALQSEADKAKAELAQLKKQLAAKATTAKTK